MKLYDNTKVLNVTDRLRIIGILLVVSCHCCHLLSSKNYSLYSRYLSGFMNSIGTLGVVLFFIISGYFFAGTVYSFLSFWKRKVKTLLIPWILTAILVYLWGTIRKGGFSVVVMGYEIIGFSSYTWYLSVLCFCYLIMWPIRDSIWAIGIIGVFSFSFACLYNAGLLGISFPQLGNVLPLNWLCYFCFGMIINRVGIPVLPRWIGVALFSIVVSITIWLTYKGLTVSYGKSFFPIYALVGSVSIVLSVLPITCTRNDIVHRFADSTFSIYLLHMPVAGVIAKLFNMLFYSPIILRVFLCVLISFCFIEMIHWVATRVGLGHIIETCIGYRKRRIDVKT